MAVQNPPTKGSVVSGSRVKLSVNGTDIGYATIASYVETITYDPIAVLDQMEIAEHVPVAYDVAFTASRVFLITDTIKNMSLFPQVAPGQNFTTALLNALLGIGTDGEMTAAIVDSSGQTIVELTGVKITSHNLTFGARAVVGEDVGFVARRVKDTIAGE
ncbi:MAG: hypothetical protein CME17_00965 [Gemmatimonadetes bacterium]|nr:hypothetical protein [Gemmatimonadota bacterium]|tara:strand:- start:498 stop:977 length:480 start_codon:yes stop_codon:yes gene_type:complete